MSLSQRYRLFELNVPDTACPACGEGASEGQVLGGEIVCGACSHAWQPHLEASDRQGVESLRFDYLSEEELFRRLADIADRRHGQVGQRYLADNDPELLFNCVAHCGSYKRARRALRQWLAERDRQRESGSGIVVKAKQQTESRCSYCHDVFEGDEESFTCACGATLHPDCRVELGRCTTMGCDADFTRPVEVSVTPRRRRAGQEEEESFLDGVWRKLIGRERVKHAVGTPWPLRLFGLAPLALGAALLSTLVHAPPGIEPPARVMLLIGLPFLLLGIGMIFGCTGSTIDRRLGTVRAWRGLRLPFVYALPLWGKAGTRRLVDYSRVRICKEVWHRGKKGGGWAMYAVKLGDQDLHGCRDYMDARRCAEKVARYIDVGLQDEVGGQEHFRPRGALDRPWLDGAGQEEFARARPRDGVIERTVQDGEAVYTVPGQVRLTISIGLAMIILGNMIFMGEGERLACFLVFLLPFLLALLYAMRMQAEDIIRASPDGLRVERRWWFGSWTYAFPADALEEVHLTRRKRRTLVSALDSDSPKVLTFISDARAVEVGAGVSEAELRWLRASVADDMRGGASPPKG